MSHPVKFRAWFNGKMHYPVFFGFENGILLWEWKDGDFNKNSREFQMFTGLCDVNDNEIYEGDILTGIKLPNVGKGTFFAQVQYVPCYYRFVATLPNGEQLTPILNGEGVYTHHLKIVGNAFANPELLKFL
jgi:hypothetical protein